MAPAAIEIVEASELEGGMAGQGVVQVDDGGDPELCGIDQHILEGQIVVQQLAGGRPEWGGVCRLG